MRWLCVLCCVLFSFAAPAADGPKPVAVRPLLQSPPNVTVIDGKRFYSLQNVRRFTGGLDSPRALSVMHHPRPLGMTVGPRHAGLPLAQPSGGAGLSGGASAGSGTGAPMAASDKEKVLSIFDPENKSLPPAAR